MQGISINNKSKLFQISINVICISYENKINIINTRDRNICYVYENINNIICAEVMENSKIFISSLLEEKENKYGLYILEWDDSENILKEKELIEDFECKDICKLNIEKAIMYTEYGINVVELKE